MPQPFTWIEIVCPLLALVSLTAYHIHYIWLVKRHPQRTALGITKHLRFLWVQSIMQQHRDMLAVQTLRNWVMASSFLASTAILISLGLLGFVFQWGRGTGQPLDFSQIVAHIRDINLIKIMLLFLIFSFAFFNFTLAIRYHNHVNFMINLPLHAHETVTIGSVSRALNLAMFHYSLGMRAYYLAAPLFLWLFGPIWLLAGTIVLLGALFKIDRTT